MEICPHGARIVLAPGRDVEFVDACVPCADLLADLDASAHHVVVGDPALV